ncbi:MAG: pyridoxamine 5'-phosphate oxidase [Candidatus Liberibacter europaeus]|uniref:Pyridoxine/pyridoxamine 5'-phosphate oxidase n=1 Tax=Candidatus Liberibacter europaeus TaxID=744859 RepID=A0A2T4VXA0_9HYPH|nr:pyridoxamine 5'-phosphate oxidase [Candidatus Liberibacter europaeus]PTL86401.1 MAG: pyridoxamine 5'-phosphate oxidase [Candidatus Liberibacter europaeus]
MEQDLLVDDGVVFALFSEWMKDAQCAEDRYPDAAVLGTVDFNGFPNSRVVLVKHFDKNGFVFYTNSKSCKGKEIIENPRVSLCFYWKSLCRQVRLRGLVEKCCDSESDLYYASRPRGSQIGAWASKQSQIMESYDILKKSVEKYSSLYESQVVPRPVWWCGFRILPIYIEFWNERLHRLHERIVFSRETTIEKWKKFMLYP